MTKEDLIKAINGYLLSGGMWNPEMANHDNVRDLLIECRDYMQQEETFEFGVQTEHTNEFGYQLLDTRFTG